MSAKLPSIEKLIQYMREFSGPVSGGFISAHFCGCNKTEMSGYLARLAESGHLTRHLIDQRVHYSIPMDASGLSAIYARPLPRVSRSRVIFRD